MTYEAEYRQFYKTLVWATTKTRLGRRYPELAEDAVQAFFLKIQTSEPVIKTTFLNYAKVSCMNMHINLVRNQSPRIRGKYLQPMELDDGMLAYNPEPEYITKSTIDYFYLFISKLPRKQKQIIMAHLAGQTHADIAERAGDHYDTTKASFRHAITNIRRMAAEALCR